MITVKKPMPGVKENDVCLTSTPDGKYYLLCVNTLTYNGDTSMKYEMELVPTKDYVTKKFYVEDGMIYIIFDEKSKSDEKSSPMQLNG